MAKKILLVEDDTNLRDIYSARFAAEGYQVITSADGEEALATAVRELPDLIILDVMMPKISGFDVLDILRSTAETKNTHIIMMTALGQDDNRAKGEALGVDQYLVKSQVTLEDIVNAAKQSLGELPAAPAATAAPAQPVPVEPTSVAPDEPTESAPETPASTETPESTDTTPPQA
jgi:DNA-binding response OmpR family regulator